MLGLNPDRVHNNEKKYIIGMNIATSSPVDQRIKSYWSNFVIDRPVWWKLLSQQIWKYLIPVNQLYWIVSGFALQMLYLLSPNRINTPHGRFNVSNYPRLSETTDHMVSIGTVKSDEFIDITSIVPRSQQKTSITVL